MDKCRYLQCANTKLVVNDNFMKDNLMVNWLSLNFDYVLTGELL